ncbi:unnamed protein product [Rotaria sordida]|uniref:Uncharacterized protein n=1 Tax=Rotaria sordida TaxID=392033 RepID=A0A819JVZ6_9BILA|nr:unnamed protein product [Rotaria sordida]
MPLYFLSLGNEDFQSGADIHETNLSHIEKNSFTIASPIHFYMQCEDVNRAEQGKSGCVDKAKNIFQSLIQLDTTGYTSMSELKDFFLKIYLHIISMLVSSYGLNGMGI